jgi:predicted peptidase
MRSAAITLAVALMAAPAPLAGQSAASGTGAPVGAPRFVETTLELPDGSSLRYGIALPEGHDGPDAVAPPLVLALHPGGRAEYYGSSFMQSIVEPGLRSWRAIMVAPDVPDRSWTTPRSEQAILALVEHVLAEHAIDRTRVLVAGFSMGGRGAWYMAARHPELFAGAIVMAGSPSAEDVERMTTPLYLIHSPSDEVVPFAPVEEAYAGLRERGHPIELRVLPGASHYMMGAYVPALRLAGEWMLARWLEDAR